MLDDPMFTAELIAEKRDREDAAWREQSRITRPDWTHAEGRSPSHVHGPLCSEDIIDTSADSEHEDAAWQAQQRRADDAAWREQYQDLKAREAWHDGNGHRAAFADCPSPVCAGKRELNPAAVARLPVPR